MILALGEQQNGSLLEGSLQMLTMARRLCELMNIPLCAAFFGEIKQAWLDTLRAHGVAEAYGIRHPGLDSYAPEAMAKGLLQLVEQKRPRIVMAAGTERGNEVLAYVGAHLHLPMAVNCVHLLPGEPFRLTRLRWGGSLLEDSILHGDPKLVSVALHSVPAEEAAVLGETRFQEFTPSLQERDFRTKVLRREKTVSEGVTLKNAPVVIGGGRGVGSEAGYRVLEELASLLGGAVGGSRVATNNGWRPHSEQIGLTGNRIAPELYIACGISGAIQHLVGCKGAKRIMVINKDPEAPFFSKADYGVLGDLHQVLPAIMEEVKKEKKQRSVAESE